MLKNLILSAAAAGLAAGLLTAVIQEMTTTPIILEAEKYEDSAAPAEAAAAAASTEAAPIEAAEALAQAEHEEWSPAEGAERTLFTTLGTTAAGVGFSLALLGAMALSGVPIGGRTGLAFGVAGFAAVSLAPALGLPPDIPGSGAAALGDRQTWWLFAVAATAGGLAALLLSRGMLLRLFGIVLIAVPHMVGAPQPEAYVSTAPAELAGHFAAASLAVTAVFWAVLGLASGAIFERLSRSG